MKATAIKAAKAAGKIQLRYFGKDVKKKFKANRSYVTIADIACTKIVRKIILKEFPTHGILDEELGQTQKASAYQWIVDPIDGTHNYIMHNPLFGVSIALQHKKEIILGVIYLPVLKRMYIAEKGKGAFCNGKRMKVNSVNQLNRSMMMYDAKITLKTNERLRLLKKLAKIVWRVRIWGVAVYNNLLIAEGNAEFNLNFNSNIWDHAAALLILEEAGGRVTDLKGKPWTPNIKNYISSNGKVHDKILKLVR